MPKIPIWLFFIIAALYFTAIRVDTMDIDASQYARMSQAMSHSDNWLQVFDRGEEYLDKPPFLFWISAGSIALFGANNFGYKLPSILMALWALWATYKLAKRLYDEDTGRLSALILGTAQGLWLMTNDVRCDTLLMGWVITAIWALYEYTQSQSNRWFFLGCAAIALGMMTKGPIALMVPVFCFATHWILQRNWKQFLKPIYLLGIMLIAILLVPMSIGLYQQFDAQPHKVVNGLTGVSGLRFFYWSQSFGRITGESPWENGADFSFLLVNMLWSFLPWIFVFLPAIITQMVLLVRQKGALIGRQEGVTLGGFMLAYLALGASAYQLPHYIFVVFPLAAIITARYMALFVQEQQFAGAFRVIRPFMLGISAVLLLAVLVLIAYIFPSGILAYTAWAIGAGLWVYFALRWTSLQRFILLPALTMIIVNVFITNVVYFKLLQYQAGSVVGHYLANEHIPHTQLACYKINDPLDALDFYAGGRTTITDNLDSLKNKPYVLTTPQNLDTLQQLGFKVQRVLLQGRFFKVSELTGQFLMPSTRNQATSPYVLCSMKN